MQYSKNGKFQLTAGVDLLVSKAPNKGAVGLTLSYYDTSIAIINCHLASDSKGKSRVERRNQQVREEGRMEER